MPLRASYGPTNRHVALMRELPEGKAVSTQTYSCVVLRMLLVLGILACGKCCSAQVPVRDPSHRVAQRTRSWKEIRDYAVVKQQRDFSCGAAALATIARYYWGDKRASEAAYLQNLILLLKPHELRERTANGLSMTDLRNLAVKSGYQASVVRASTTQLAESKVPTIVAIRTGRDRELNHFVVVKGILGNDVFLADPARGNLRVPLSRFEEDWIENALLVMLRPGKVTSAFSRLKIQKSDWERGWLNGQVTRGVPRRAFARPY